MKKLLLFLLINMALLYGAKAQNGYYDALKLRSYIDVKKIGTQTVAQFRSTDKDGDSVADYVNAYSTLAPYFGLNPGDNVTLDDFNKMISANPFLKTNKVSIPNEINNSRFDINAKGALNAIGGIDVTNFADGLAKFLIERSKEELNVAFFSRFKDFFDKYPEMGVIFPTTTSFLKNIYAYQYAAMLPALREGFHQDLNNIFGNMVKLRDLDISDCPSTAKNDNCTERILAIKEFVQTPKGRAVISALIIADNLQKGNNAAVILKNLAKDTVCNKSGENFSETIQLANIISSSFRSKNDDETWVSTQEIKSMLSDPVSFRIYMGLVYAMNSSRPHPITFNTDNGTVELKTILDKIAEGWDSASAKYTVARNAFEKISDAMNSASSIAKEITNAQKNDTNNIGLYGDYAKSVSHLLTVLVNTPGDLGINIPELKTWEKEVSKITSILDISADACYDIKAKNYTTLALRTSMLLDTMLSSKYQSLKDGYIKYATFMASVVEAQNSDDVQVALNAAVLPAGSSSIKRETKMNIAINAYIGATGGTEWMPKLKTNEWKPVVGLTAPVGVAFSRGDIKFNKESKTEGGKSITLFVPLIDVGAIAMFRLNDDSTEVASKITLANIISPGLYVYYGFGKCPISLGVGGQVGPQLRNITATGALDNNQNFYMRFGLNLVVDIPFFNLYTNN